MLSCIFLLQLGSYKSTTKNGVLHYPIMRTKGMSCKRQIILACTIHVQSMYYIPDLKPKISDVPSSHSGLAGQAEEKVAVQPKNLKLHEGCKSVSPRSDVLICNILTD